MLFETHLPSQSVPEKFGVLLLKVHDIITSCISFVKMVGVIDVFHRGICCKCSYGM